MKEIITYINEFTGEVFTDRKKCEQAEKESKIQFRDELIENINLIKDICNHTGYCADCPFSSLEDGEDIECLVSPFVDDYLSTVRNLSKIGKMKV